MKLGAESVCDINSEKSAKEDAVWNGVKTLHSDQAGWELPDK